VFKLKFKLIIRKVLSFLKIFILYIFCYVILKQNVQKITFDLIVIFFFNDHEFLIPYYEAASRILFGVSQSIKIKFRTSSTIVISVIIIRHLKFRWAEYTSILYPYRYNGSEVPSKMLNNNMNIKCILVMHMLFFIINNIIIINSVQFVIHKYIYYNCICTQYIIIL